MRPRSFVSGLILAAGLSSRFGRAKQLAELGGIPLVERAVRTLLDSDVDEVVVVLGHESGRVRERLRTSGARLVENPDYRTGLSSSLKQGVKSLDPRSEAVVVVLSDQPFVTQETVDEVVGRFRGKGSPAVGTVAGGTVSPPVLFSRALYPEVAILSGDKGAKAIIMNHPDFERVEVETDTVLDIDTEEELRKAGELLRARGQAPGGPSRPRPSSGKSSSRRRAGSHRSD